MPKTRLAVEALETRDVPALFGIPWANGSSLTLSFAPDGADVDGSANELYSLMARSGLSQNVWQGEILRAVQQWTSNADLNVGVVSDDGSSLGVPGLEQADSRFGDIRIFAAPLSSNVLAITAAPGDLAGTRTGDIILNSNYNFGVGFFAQRDLYTVLLQEGGHALGVGNSADSTSVMYEFYQGVRSGLNAEDFGRIRGLYGARPTSAFEQAGGNGTIQAATVLPNTRNVVAIGDIASASDADWYRFVGPTGMATVALDVAGTSLLAAKLTVYDSSSRVVARATASGPGQNLSLALASLRTGATYYALVEDAGNTSFAAGAYLLRITSDASAAPTVFVAGQTIADDSSSNESTLSATRLNNVGSNGATAFRTFAQLRSGDSDVYVVRSPFPGLNQANVLTATVKAFGDIDPRVRVYDILGLPVAFRLTADGNGLYTVVVSKAAPNADYYIAVDSRTNSAGTYDLKVNFRSEVSTVNKLDSGLLTILSPTATGQLDVTGSAQMYFRLAAAQTLILGPSITVRVRDSLNRIKFQMTARGGDTVDGVILLGTGRYTLEITGNGSLLPFVASAYTLSGTLISDPVGATPANPNQSGGSSTSSPPPPPPSSYQYSNNRGYYASGSTTQPPSGS